MSEKLSCVLLGMIQFFVLVDDEDFSCEIDYSTDTVYRKPVSDRRYRLGTGAYCIGPVLTYDLKKDLTVTYMMNQCVQISGRDLLVMVTI